MASQLPGIQIKLQSSPFFVCIWVRVASSTAYLRSTDKCGTLVHHARVCGDVAACGCGSSAHNACQTEQEGTIVTVTCQIFCALRSAYAHHHAAQREPHCPVAPVLDTVPRKQP